MITPVSAATTLPEVLPGVSELQRGDLEGARAKVTAHLEKNPDDAKAWYFLALTYEQQNDAPGAIAIYEKVLNNDPSDFEAYSTCAKTLKESRPADNGVAIPHAQTTDVTGGTTYSTLKTTLFSTTNGANRVRLERKSDHTGFQSLLDVYAPAGSPATARSRRVCDT